MHKATPPARFVPFLSHHQFIPIISYINKPSKLSFNLPDTLKLFLTTYRLFIMFLASISSLLFILLIMQTRIIVSALPISGTIAVASAWYETGQASDSNRSGDDSNYGNGYNTVPPNNTPSK